MRPTLSWLGLILAALAVLGVYVAAIVILSRSLPDDKSGNNTPGIVAEGEKPGPAPKFSAADYRQSRFPPISGKPLIGVNYTHYAFPRCTFRETYILSSYGRPGVAEKVHGQLLRMRKAGVETLRTLIWHMTDPTGKEWGPISSAGGKLHEPNRTNFIRYLTEVKKFGFARLTIGFQPQDSNDPLRLSYDPRKFRENWRFIRVVRALVKRYGPRDTRIDLFSEGAPNETPTSYEPRPRQTARYIRSLYRAYVQRYGNRDVSVSAIGSMKPHEPTNRLDYLIRTLRSSGEPLPRWYDVHIGFDSAGASYALRQARIVLDAQRQKQPVTIGDTAYDSVAIADAIQRFGRSGRRLDEVSPWYMYTKTGCPVSPPYSPGAYGRQLG